MKIVIDVEDSQSYGLSPTYVYRRLKDEHQKALKAVHNDYFWGMGDSCDRTDRELYGRITGRSPNVKNLILTYKDAETCFEIYKKFSDVWVEEIA